MSRTAGMFGRLFAADKDPPSRGRWGRLLRAGGVQRTPEFERIHALPRRRWQDDPDVASLVDWLGRELRVPGGERPCGVCRPSCVTELRPVQAVALAEAHDVRGLVAPIDVGGGKTLLSLLLPTVLGAERPLLLVPARLRDDTISRRIPALSRHWRLHPRQRVHAYSELSTEDGADLLDRIRPDLLVADEAHRLKNLDAGRTRRVKRWMDGHPETAFCPLSGTLTSRSLLDYWHLLAWALKPSWTPLPGSWREVSDWARAIDAGIPEDRRQRPGVLAEWTTEGEDVRDGYGRRLVETPGVVAHDDTGVRASLRIYARRPSTPETVLRMVAEMRAGWETPNGEPILEAVELWRHARELALGFWMRWDPPAPADWIEARKEWGAFVRHVLSSNRRELDTPLQVWNEQERIERTGLDALGRRARPATEWLAWRAVEGSFVPNPVPEWVDDFAIADATRWLLEEDDGIVWTEHVPFARRLSAASGVRYYGAGEDDDAALANLDGGRVIASVRAHGEGKDLQRWHRNLVVAPSPSGRVWQQLIGRTHRPGQGADEVVFHVNQHLDELTASLRRAYDDAAYLEATTRARQKLLIADLDFDPGLAI